MSSISEEFHVMHIDLRAGWDSFFYWKSYFLITTVNCECECFIDFFANRLDGHWKERGYAFWPIYALEHCPRWRFSV